MTGVFNYIKFMELYSQGMTDREIAAAMGLSNNYVKNQRNGRKLEANSSTTGPLGQKVKDFMKTYEPILDNKEDTDEMIDLCQNCPFSECLNCVGLYKNIRKHARRAA